MASLYFLIDNATFPTLFLQLQRYCTHVTTEVGVGLVNGTTATK